MRTYEISKQVKKGTFDSDVIDSVMSNKTTAGVLSFINEAEKTRVRELYSRVILKDGDIRFDAFWHQLRDCFD